ncbi:effector-associated domain EAD1-containing protein [Sagittula salina]|uniref:Effector-associated domain-containing protein n=1 Tax=Sagittula salina TaxID=2820268 RepID=A0A940MM15_9RHOB|nr:effector-associated domain EAD1-containing protein [Sagittula salina]MBP0482220.1 hypothetical protein [Sagittula salina]
MHLSPEDIGTLHGALLGAYPAIAGFDHMLKMPPIGKNREDIILESNGVTRPVIYEHVIHAAQAQNWLTDLIRGVLNAQDAHSPLHATLAPLLDRHAAEATQTLLKRLTCDGVAFANRDGLRDTLTEMLNVEGPRVLVLYNDGRRRHCGTSYSWYLVNVLAREKAKAERIYHDFDDFGDHSPTGLIDSLCLQMGFDPPDIGDDRPSDAQLAARYVLKFLGLFRNSDRTWWIVLDNAHRAHVPPETREMIAGIARKVSSGAMERVRLFVLGFDRRMSNLHANYSRQDSLRPLSRDHVQRFVEDVRSRYNALGDYADVDAALEDLLADVDFDAPDLEKLQIFSDKLGRLIPRAPR